MAARKPSRKKEIPSLGSISPPARAKGKAYDAVVLGDDPKRAAARSPILSKQIQDQAIRNRDGETDAAIEMSKLGDDSFLLPYQPTPSINPPRPRTVAAGYDPETEILRVRFRDGTPWEYGNVPPRVWRNFKRVKSPGRFINRTLNQYPYWRGDF